MLAHTVVTSIDQQARLEAKLRRELGDLVLRALSDERTEDIVLNPDSRLWVKRQSEGFECVGEMPPASEMRSKGSWLLLVSSGSPEPPSCREQAVDRNRVAAIKAQLTRPA